MTAVLALAAIALQSAPDPAQTISTLFKHYYDCPALNAEIVFTQSAKGQKVVMNTAVQYERPKKIYVKQVRQPKTDLSANDAVIASDGIQFTYDKPFENRLPNRNDRLFEEQKESKIDDVYVIGASGLIDRSPVLDILVARPDSLKRVSAQLVTVKSVESDDEDITIIQGNWRPFADDPVQGTYELVITKGGELKSFAIQQGVGAPTGEIIQVLSRWDVKLEYGKVKDPKLFRVTGI